MPREKLGLICTTICLILFCLGKMSCFLRILSPEKSCEKLLYIYDNHMFFIFFLFLKNIKHIILTICWQGKLLQKFYSNLTWLRSNTNTIHQITVFGSGENQGNRGGKWSTRSTISLEKSTGSPEKIWTACQPWYFWGPRLLPHMAKEEWLLPRVIEHVRLPFT